GPFRWLTYRPEEVLAGAEGPWRLDEEEATPAAARRWTFLRRHSGGRTGAAAPPPAGLGLLLSLLRPRSVFDAGCGDAGWLRQVDLGGDVEYMGADIVPDVVTANGEALGGPGRRFVCMDIVESAPAAHDLIVCRDVLSYLPNGDVLRALDGFRRSGSR